MHSVGTLHNGGRWACRRHKQAGEHADITWVEHADVTSKGGEHADVTW